MKLAILFLLSAILLGSILESSAVEYTDSKGYTPDWATNIDQDQVILKCETDISTENDIDWCIEYLDSLLAGLKTDPIIQEIEAKSDLIIPAPFVDTSKDPQSYVDRYNNEPKYKEWFDGNYPQYSSIYQAVGLEEPKCANGEEWIESDNICMTPEPEMETEPKSVSKETKTQTKEFGDDYYVDESFGFAIKIPNGSEIDNEAITIGDTRALIAFNFGGDDDVTAGYNIHYFHGDPDLINYDDLLYYFSETPQTAGGEYTQQIKINNKEIEEQDDRYKITYEFTTKAYYPEDYFLSHMAGKTIMNGNKIVIFLYPNGDWYELLFFSGVSTYSTDVKTFDYVVDTFYAGNVKKISSNTGNSNSQTSDSSAGGGCLIATAIYGTELAPQVQKLREIRDSKLSQTESGTSFMSGFNQFYYSFSPYIADWERESPMFKEAVKIAITPMITTLSLMDYADTESEVLGIGISLIALNLGMYLGVPMFGIVLVRKKF